MRKKSLKLVTVTACMILGMSLFTACGGKDMSAEEAGAVVSEVKEDLDDAKEDIEDAKEDVKEAKEEVKENLKEAEKEVSEAEKEVTGDTEAVDISGSWRDGVSSRAGMEATKNDDGSFDIIIHWGGSVSEAAEWVIHGTFDSATGTLTYDNGSYAIHTYDEDGNDTVSDEETTTGTFVIDGDKVKWQDSKASSECLFERGVDEASAAAGDGGEHISTLPDYSYKGGDPYIGTIAQFMIENMASGYEAHDICIPCITIVDVDDSNPDDVLVWGDFWIYNYNLNGDTLECESGGNYPGLVHVQNGLVSSFDVVADGGDYEESAREIFGDRYDKFESIHSDDTTREATRAQFISDYVKEHSLDITKYKDYGWDPVELPQ